MTIAIIKLGDNEVEARRQADLARAYATLLAGGGAVVDRLAQFVDLTGAIGAIPYFSDADTLGLLTLDTDTALGANSDARLASQKAVKAFVAAQIAALVNGAPGALDTLKELADAIGDDASYAASITALLAAKAPLASPALTGTPTAPTAAAGTNTTQLATTAFVKAAVVPPVEVLAQSGTGWTAPADTSEDTLVSYTLPAGKMGANDRLEITTLWQFTNSANNKTLKVKFGGTAFFNIVQTAVQSAQQITFIQNANATNAQIGMAAGVTQDTGTTSGAPVTSAVDTTAAVTILITGQKASSGETLKLLAYSIKLVRAPS